MCSDGVGNGSHSPDALRFQDARAIEAKYLTCKDQVWSEPIRTTGTERSDHLAGAVFLWQAN